MYHKYSIFEKVIWSFLFMSLETSSAVYNLLKARRLASFCPSSLSLDDFKKYPRCIKKSTEDEDFIPPTSKVSIIKDSKPETNLSTKMNRFSFLLKQSSSAQKIEESSIKVDYSIPNIQTIGTFRKKPILVVSLSSTSLSSPVKNQNTKPIESIQNLNHIIGEAKQIDTEISSDSESD